MDLQAAKQKDNRVSTLARVSMAACFAVASLMLLASLSSARGNSQSIENASRPSHSLH